MTQRGPRLGDIVDDYCPREKRITNHAVVAMIGDDVKQTRCATCESDHEYKKAKVPSQRGKKVEMSPLDSAIEAQARAVTQDEPADAGVNGGSSSGGDAGDAEVGSTLAASGQSDKPDSDLSLDDGPVHRRLIRASLPRPAGQLPERRPTDFTVRQPGRGGDRGGREVDGNRAGGNRDSRPGRGQSGGGGQPRFGGQPPGNGSRQQNGDRDGGQSPGGQGQRQGRPGGGRRRRGR